MFPKISVVSKSLNQSAPTLFFSSSSLMFLYFILYFVRSVFAMVIIAGNDGVSAMGGKRRIKVPASMHRQTEAAFCELI